MFTLPDLPYDYDALGTYISKDIMQLHHDKHHQTYVDKLNVALAPFPELARKPIGHLLRDLDTLPKEIQTAVRNHGGGHYNHSLFWEWMSPHGGGEPTGEVAAAIIARYGSFQAFVDEFTTNLWQYLVVDGHGCSATWKL